MSRITFAILAAFRLCNAATLYYDWESNWIEASPDGFQRPVIAINNIWPCPEIRANVGDEIVVKYTNSLGNQSSSLHWHGISQYGTNQMDGASSVAQCPIISGSSYTYRFTVCSCAARMEQMESWHVVNPCRLMRLVLIGGMLTSPDSTWMAWEVVSLFLEMIHMRAIMTKNWPSLFRVSYSEQTHGSVM